MRPDKQFCGNFTPTMLATQQYRSVVLYVVDLFDVESLKRQSSCHHEIKCKSKRKLILFLNNTFPVNEIIAWHFAGLRLAL